MSSHITFFAAVLAMLGAAGIFFLKRAGDSLLQYFTPPIEYSKLLASLLFNFNLWIGVGLYLIAFLWMMNVISRVPISLFYPLAVGINIILTSLMGVFLLNEVMSIGRLVGILLILLGVIIAST